jgi:hypothetical protein
MRRLTYPTVAALAVAASVLPLIRSDRILLRVEVEDSARRGRRPSGSCGRLWAWVVPSGTRDCCNGGCALAD